jgi:hypothetical protein
LKSRFFPFFAGLDFLERRQSKAHKDFAKITLDYFLAPSNCARKIYRAVGTGVISATPRNSGIQKKEQKA